MKDFFDRRHNPLWRVGPTADAAKALLEFWRKTDPDTGRIVDLLCRHLLQHGAEQLYICTRYGIAQ